ncbi:hypothetical protein FRC12_017017 [Ceratobasidium sp. 428]|nr:hypothetical protein FRC12_017017 [Ceratobasidium sp. 428]
MLRVPTATLPAPATCPRQPKRLPSLLTALSAILKSALITILKQTHTTFLILGLTFLRRQHENGSCEYESQSDNGISADIQVLPSLGAAWAKSGYTLTGKPFQNDGSLATSLPHNTPPERFGQPLHGSHPHLVAAGELTPGIQATEYHERRRKLVDSLPPGSIVVSRAAMLKYMSGRKYFLLGEIASHGS